MNKNDFLNNLEKALSGLPQEEVRRTLDYYSEIIDDAAEEGEVEENVIAGFGAPEDIAGKIINDMPLRKLVKEDVKRRKLTGTEIVLIIVASPILIAIAAVIFAVYISVWSVVASLFAVSLSLFLAGIALIGAAPFVLGDALPKAVFFIGAALVCAGVSVFVFYLAMWCAKGMIAMSVFLMRRIKAFFIKKRGENNED